MAKKRHNERKHFIKVLLSCIAIEAFIIASLPYMIYSSSVVGENDYEIVVGTVDEMYYFGLRRGGSVHTLNIKVNGNTYYLRCGDQNKTVPFEEIGPEILNKEVVLYVPIHIKSPNLLSQKKIIAGMECESTIYSSVGEFNRGQCINRICSFILWFIFFIPSAIILPFWVWVNVPENKKHKRKKHR